MYKTIRLASCVSVQGEMVAALEDGEVIVRDGRKMYRGRPFQQVRAAQAGSGSPAREFEQKHRRA